MPFDLFHLSRSYNSGVLRRKKQMNKNLEKIHEYLMSKGVSEKELLQSDTSSVYLAMEIMEYAHRNQKRENGEDYANHPTRVLNFYRDLVGIKPNDLFCIDEDLMCKYQVPYNGVQEVCLLHDVIEDTDFTIDDLRDIYVECGFEKYFDIYIKDALLTITHDKSISYEEYIKTCLKNPISALVKMIDLQDNLFVLDLVSLTKEKYERSQRYLSYIPVINNVYHFLENAYKYKEAFKKESK